MKYSKLFNWLSEHTGYVKSSSYVEPYASYIKETDSVRYNYIEEAEPEPPIDPKELEYMHFKSYSGDPYTVYLNTSHSLVKTGNIDMWYSYDKKSWSRFPTKGGVLANMKQTVYLKGENPNGIGAIEFSEGGDIDSFEVYPLFTFKGNVLCNGNIMSLVYGDNFAGQYEIPADYCFAAIFVDTSNIKSSPLLPAKILKPYCYAGMFAGAENVNNSITEAPVLPAKTLAEGCYKNMFSYNGNLTEGPVLPAKTLVKSCYERMFSDCRSINYIKAMFTTTPSPAYTEYWCYNVPSTGTFVKNSEAEWNIQNDYYGIPVGWTIQTASS